MQTNDVVLGVECALPQGFAPYEESSGCPEAGMPPGEVRLTLVINRYPADAACV